VYTVAAALSATGQITGTKNGGLLGEYTFYASADTPKYAWNESDAAANNRLWSIAAGGGLFVFAADSVDGAGIKEFLRVARASTAITSIAYGNATDNPTNTWLGTGAGLYGGSFTVTGQGIFNGSGGQAGNTSMISLNAGDVGLGFNESSEALNQKLWDMGASASIFSLRLLLDDGSTAINAIAFTRVGRAVTDIAIGNATDNSPLRILGTGLVTISGKVNVTATGGWAIGDLASTGRIRFGLDAATAFGFLTAANAYAPVYANQVILNGLGSDASAAVQLISNQPTIRWRESDGGVDQKEWDATASANQFLLRTRTDALGAGQTWLAVSRSGAGIAAIALGEAVTNPTFTLLGTGALSIGSAVSVWEASGPDIRIGSGAGSPTLRINSLAGTGGSDLAFQRASLNRFIWRLGSVAESGGDAGSPLQGLARTDAGGAIDTWFSLVRAAGGLLSLSRPISFSDATEATAIGAASMVFAGGISVAKNIFLSGRLCTDKGAAVASASDITLGTDGNLFHITGNTGINRIATANWQAGSIIILHFDSNPVVNHQGVATGGGFAGLNLRFSVDFTASVNSRAMFYFEGTDWWQISPIIRP
jgi:hypothetical protein